MTLLISEAPAAVRPRRAGVLNAEPSGGRASGNACDSALFLSTALFGNASAMPIL
jgi:hypothetical protein